MQTYSPDLLALYAAAPGTQIYRAHLFKIGPTRNGAYLYATDGRRPINFDAGDGLGVQQYHPWLYGFWQRGSQTVKIGFESNSIDCTVFSDEQFQPIYFPGTSNSVFLLDGVYAGLLQATPVTIYRATMTKWGVIVGPNGGSLVSTRFVGEVGEINDLGPTRCTVKVRDLMYRLNLDTPNQLIQANCRWVLYSTGCTRIASNFTVTGQAIGAIVDPRSFNPVTNLTSRSPAGTFAQGVIKFTKGRNNNIAYTVAQWTPGGGGPDLIVLDRPPLFNMTVGDTFSIQQGCNHTFASCLDFQGNVDAYLNFGGAPFTPVPETAV